MGPGNYETDTAVQPNKILESYWTTDIEIEQTLHDQWTIALRGSNVFDKGYETYVANFTDSVGKSTLPGYPDAGRSIREGQAGMAEMDHYSGGKGRPGAPY